MRFIKLGLILLSIFVLACKVDLGANNSKSKKTVNVCDAPVYACTNTTLGIIPISAIPNVGNLTGGGTVAIDPDFGSSIMRATDTTFESHLSNNLITSYSVAGSGSGDENHFNCNEDRLIISDQGGQNFVSTFTWGKANQPMYKSATWPRGLFFVGATFFGHNCSTPYKIYTWQGSKLGYYDVSSLSTVPVFNQVADLASSANCLGFGSDFPTTVASDGIMAAGSNILTSASVPFNSSMIGMPIKVARAGTNGTDLTTTIKSYQGTGQVTLNAFAASAVSTASVQVVKITWSSGGETNRDDSDFSIAVSNNGGQAGPGAVYGVVYRVGSGCRVINLNTFKSRGDWGATGSITSTTNCGGRIHNLKSYKANGSGAALIITLNGGTGCTTGGYIWFYTGQNYVPQCTTQCGGHFTEGLSAFVNTAGNSNMTTSSYWTWRLNTNIAGWKNLTPSLPVGGYPGTVDWHCGWNSLNDVYPFACSTFVPNIGTTFNNGWQAEIILIDPSGAKNPMRAAHTFNSSLNPSNFQGWIAVGSFSPSGRYFAFTSDWEGQLGSTAGLASCDITTNCRSDVFVLDLTNRTVNQLPNSPSGISALVAN